MSIGIVAPPFISVPPKTYGGTELFLAHLTSGLHARGHRVTLYANGESRVPCELRWRYRQSEWPPAGVVDSQLKNIEHLAWAVHEAASSAEVIHVNDPTALPLTVFVGKPFVMTVHHPQEPVLSDLYLRYPSVQYVAISENQARLEPTPNIRVVPHGVALSEYEFVDGKRDYLLFLGRMAPCKGPHLAIEVARRAGLPLLLAGEVQPVFRSYWEEQVLPGIDGDQIR